jgi:hypothetical protein
VKSSHARGAGWRWDNDGDGDVVVCLHALVKSVSVAVSGPGASEVTCNISTVR